MWKRYSNNVTLEWFYQTFWLKLVLREICTAVENETFCSTFERSFCFSQLKWNGSTSATVVSSFISSFFTSRLQHVNYPIDFLASNGFLQFWATVFAPTSFIDFLKEFFWTQFQTESLGEVNRPERRSCVPLASCFECGICVSGWLNIKSCCTPLYFSISNIHSMFRLFLEFLKVTTIQYDMSQKEGGIAHVSTRTFQTISSCLHLGRCNSDIHRSHLFNGSYYQTYISVSEIYGTIIWIPHSSGHSEDLDHLRYARLIRSPHCVTVVHCSPSVRESNRSHKKKKNLIR